MRIEDAWKKKIWKIERRIVRAGQMKLLWAESIQNDER